MQYTQAQIDRANAVSLEDFLRTQGETLIKSGREYRWKEHDSLTVRGNKWFRHSQSKGGYPIDFVMEFYGKSFPEAVQLLTGESGEGQTEATTAPPTAFHLPLHNRTADRAIQYLCESRGLNPKLVEAFLLSGDIYEDAKRHNVVFVGRDRSGTPRYAHVRGTADPFRQDTSQSASTDTKAEQLIPASTIVAAEKVKIVSVADNPPEDRVQAPKVIVTQPKEEASVDMIAYLTELLGKAAKATAVVKSESTQQRVKIDALTQTLESEQSKLRGANQQIADLQDTITELRKKLSAAEGDIFVLRQTVEQRDAVIAEKNAEIAERVKMAEVLSRDRSKQADESLQRLASKIRVEYRDFVDALDVPISCDLGENLRLQLQSIFDILEKGGMKFK